MEYEKETSKDNIIDKIQDIRSLLEHYKSECKHIEDFINTQNDLADDVINKLYEDLDLDIENLNEEINDLISSIDNEKNLSNIWNISLDNCEICIEFLEYIYEYLQDQDIDKAIMILNEVNDFKDIKKINNKISKEKLKQNIQNLKKQGKTINEIIDNPEINLNGKKLSRRTIFNYLKEIKE